MTAIPILRHSRWDMLLVLAPVCAGLWLALHPAVWTIALAQWWIANTAAHCFIHLPFFSARWANSLFSAALTLLVGVPQRVWRERHLAHHADRKWKFRGSPQFWIEAALLAAFWSWIAAADARFFCLTYLPGLALGLCLCLIQGHFEHHRGVMSHYGRIYNALFFNDGYHAEHHLKPAAHWRSLPAHKLPGSNASRWPPALRWLDWSILEGLEHLVARMPALQRWVLRAHEQALRRVLADLPPPKTVCVVGGGLFPRTAIILRKIWQDAEIWILDSNEVNLAMARSRLGDAVKYRLETFHGGPSEEFDVITIPLAYSGDRHRIYAAPPSRLTLVHDWHWRRRGAGALVSWALLKRINLVQ